MNGGLIFSLLCSAIAIGFGVFTIFRVLAHPDGNAEMQRIALAIREGASAYLKRQYTTIGVVGVILFILIYFELDHLTAIGFAIGAIMSGAAGFIGMHVSVRSNSRTAEAARHGLNAALKVAFSGGAVTGMLVVGLGLLAVAGYYTALTILAGPSIRSFLVDRI